MDMNPHGFEELPPDPSTLRLGAWFVGLISLGGALVLVFQAVSPDTSRSSRTIGDGLTALFCGGLGFLYLKLWSARTRLLVGPEQVGA